MRVLVRVVITGVLVTLIAGTGCASIMQRGAKEAVERGTGVKVDEDGNKVRVKTNEGTVEAESSKEKVPSGFPSQFPIYEGATVKNSSKVTSPQGTVFTVTWEVSDAADQVADFYKDKLPANGYTITNTVESGGQVSMVLENNGAVSIKSEGGKTQIAAFITSK